MDAGPDGGLAAFNTDFAGWMGAFLPPGYDARRVCNDGAVTS